MTQNEVADFIGEKRIILSLLITPPSVRSECQRPRVFRAEVSP